MPEFILERLQKKIHYSFADLKHLKHALTHRSAEKQHNERLEYLGDSILNMVIAEYLFMQFPAATEGQLSRLRAQLVREKTLAELAQAFDLSDALILGPGELKSGGHRRASILADAIEAIIAAIYLEAGLEQVKICLHKWYADYFVHLDPNAQEKDPKTRLQEWLQGKQLPLPSYEVIQTQGRAHHRLFTVCCEVEGFQPTTAQSTSRRKAEQAAASLLLEQITCQNNTADS